MTGYFALILHFNPDNYREKISTFMRVLKPKLRTNSLNQKSKFIYFVFLTVVGGWTYQADREPVMTAKAVITGSRSACYDVKTGKISCYKSLFSK